MTTSVAVLAARLRNSVGSRTYCVYGISVETGPELKSRKAVMRLGASDELQPWRQKCTGLLELFFADRAEGWHHFCWALVGSDPVGIVWVTYFSPPIQVQHGEAAIVDLYTVPAPRGRGICAPLVVSACTKMRRLGVPLGDAVVESGNVPSSRAFQEAGFQVIASFTSRRVLHRKPSTLKWNSQLAPGFSAQLNTPKPRRIATP